jgi:hypothetical protein
MLQFVNGRPSQAGRVLAVAITTSISASAIRRGRPGPSGRRRGHPVTVERVDDVADVSSSAATNRAITAHGLVTSTDLLRELVKNNWPLDTGPYPFVWVDALVIKVGEQGLHVRRRRRRLAGLPAQLDARDLSGVRLVIPDAHRGLVSAVGAARTGARSGRTAHKNA